MAIWNVPRPQLYFRGDKIIIICSTILSLPIENCLSYLVYVTLKLTKYPASKGAQCLLWLKRSIRVVRALEVSTQIFLHIYVTVHLQFLRMLSDSKRARMKKKPKGEKIDRQTHLCKAAERSSRRTMASEWTKPG